MAVEYDYEVEENIELKTPEYKEPIVEWNPLEIASLSLVDDANNSNRDIAKLVFVLGSSATWRSTVKSSFDEIQVKDNSKSDTCLVQRVPTESGSGLKLICSPAMTSDGIRVISQTVLKRFQKLKQVIVLEECDDMDEPRLTAFQMDLKGDLKRWRLKQGALVDRRMASVVAQAVMRSIPCVGVMLPADGQVIKVADYCLNSSTSEFCMPFKWDPLHSKKFGHFYI